MPPTIGPFEVLDTLGQGGMGIVHRARDTRLGRVVALKTIPPERVDETARRRLRREARAAAGVSHPNVCQVFEVGEDEGVLWVAMELLEGETLDRRLARGPLDVAEAGRVAGEVLDALAAVHAAGVVHRDLKPSNVFLTPHGSKILDFGLALPTAQGPAEDAARLTASGAVLGTPGFMAPEQWTRGETGPAADVFAVGALLYEMLAGRPAFGGATVVDVCHAALHGEPPPLVGGPAVAALDAALRRALAKAPALRPSAAELRRDVARALERASGGEAARVRSAPRFVALPFRVLRADPEIADLAAGLPEAVSASLAAASSVAVRSSRAAARFAGPDLDLRRLAAETESDVALTGTVARSGDRLRVTAQLVELPSGAVLRSEVLDGSLGDVFALQDDLARRVARALGAAGPGSLGGTPLQVDVPADPDAYRLFLRAEQASQFSGRLEEARDLYRACLARDERYAPAWARLGRALRVLAKYGQGDASALLGEAESAFRRALELNPRSSVAHSLYTAFEIEERGRPVDAMVRLLRRVREGGEDAELLSGLVTACRFGGLLEASVAAHRRARRLDPTVRTSAAYTYWARGEFDLALASEEQDFGFMRHYALPMLGRVPEAIEACRSLERRAVEPVALAVMESTRTALSGDLEGCVAATRRVSDLGFHDPEGLYFGVRNLARLGETVLSMGLLERVVAGGFVVPPLLRGDPWIAPLRALPAFGDVLARAEKGHAAAVAAFVAHQGPDLLDVPAPVAP